MHTLSTRKPTPKEQHVISALVKPDYSSFGCLTVLAGASAWAFGKFGYWIGSFVSESVATYAQWTGWIAGIALGIPILVALIPYDRKQRELAKRDHESQLVQELYVTDARVIEVEMVGNIGPNLAIDIGDEKILYLQGQWLCDCAIYGAELPDNDEEDGLFNGLPAPHSFPCSEFTISRLPNTGEVLQIHVAGTYLPPEARVEALKSKHQFQPSELFSGSLDDLASIMDDEHLRRNG